MKFRSYQVQGQLGPSAKGITNFKYSNPGAVAAAKESGNIGTTFGQGMLGIVEKVNSVKAMEANNYYNMRMSEESADLINNHKEGEALDITSLYDDVQQKVMDETMSKYGAFIRYGKEAEQFKEFTDRDNITRRNNMMKYQMVETEKHEETVFQGQVQQCQQMASIGSYSPEAMTEGKNRMTAVVEQRYAKYGEERVRQETKKQIGGLAQSGIEYLMGNNDFDKADVMLKEYEDYVPAEQRDVYIKAITAKQREKSIRDEVERLYANHKDDIQAALNELQNGGSFNAQAYNDYVNQNSGQSYLLGGYDCGFFTQHAMAAAGVVLNSRLADGQYMECEEKGLITTNKEEAGPYSLVFWHVKGNDSRWPPTDNPNEGGANGDKAYKGITHVGILQPDGTVMQMGGEGLKAIPLDTYDVVGFGKVGGVARKPEEVEAIKNGLIAKIKEEKTIQNIKISKMVDEYEKQALEMKNSGMGGYSIFTALTNGVTDPDQYKAIKAAMGQLGLSISPPRASNSSGGGSRKGKGASLGDDGAAALEGLLREGKFNNKAELVNFLADNGYGESALKKAGSMWDQYTSNKGVFKYDLNSLATDAVSQFGITGERKKLIKDGMLDVGRLYVMKYRAEHDGEDPEESEVLEAMINSNTGKLTFGGKYDGPSWFGSDQMQASTAELASLGIQAIEPVEDEDGNVRENEFWVIYKDPNRNSEWHTGQEIESMFRR